MIGRAALIASGFAIAEILLGFGPGHFIIRERAEPDAFLAFRPWLIVLVVFATGVMRGAWAGQISAATYFVLLATASEWAVLALAGNPDAGVMLRSMVLGFGLALATVGVAALFRLAFADRTLAAGAALVFSVGMLALRPPMPSMMRLLEDWLRPAPMTIADRPRTILLTDLPLVWGRAAAEQIMAGQSRPAAVWQSMNRVAKVHPIDVIDGKAWAGARLLILAQPRALDPMELVRIDEWVRGGGAALIFADPRLSWAAQMQGRAIQPPVRSFLTPLMAYWGLEISAGPTGWRLLDARPLGAKRLAVIDPGVIQQAPSTCRVAVGGLVADCKIGRGRAIVAADADLLSDAAWAGPGGTSRAARTADNGLFVEGAMRALLGLPPLADPADDVRWMNMPRSSGLLLAIGLAIPLLAAAAGLAGRLRRS